MTDTAPPEQILTEAADRAMELSEHFAVPGGTGRWSEGATHLAYLAGLIRGGITNVVTAYDRGWDEGYDAAPTPLAAPADMAAVWQGLNDEQRAVVCVVSPELAGMLDAAEDHAELDEVKTETQAELPPYYLARLREALGSPVWTLDEIVEQVEKRQRALSDALGGLDLYRDELIAALALDVRAEVNDAELIARAVGVITRARHVARLWSGNAGEPTQGTTTQALRDLVHYLDERAA